MATGNVPTASTTTTSDTTEPARASVSPCKAGAATAPTPGLRGLNRATCAERSARARHPRHPVFALRPATSVTREGDNCSFGSTCSVALDEVPLAVTAQRRGDVSVSGGLGARTGRRRLGTSTLPAPPLRSEKPRPRPEAHAGCTASRGQSCDSSPAPPVVRPPQLLQVHLHLLRKTRRLTPTSVTFTDFVQLRRHRHLPPGDLGSHLRPPVSAFPRGLCWDIGFSVCKMEWGCPHACVSGGQKS